MKVDRFIGSKLKAEENAKGSTIGIISVALSIAVIIIAVTVVAGFRREIKTKASGFMGELALVQPGQSVMNDKYPFTDSISYLEELGSQPYVDKIQPVAYTAGLLKTEENIYAVYLKGIDSLYDGSFFQSVLVEGEMPVYSGRISNDVVISTTMADVMGYELGSSITAYFISDEVKVRRFNVCGIYDAQLENIDKTLLLADIRHVQRINGWNPDEVSAIEVSLRDGVPIDAGFRAVEEFVFEHGSEADPGLFTTSIKRIFPNLFDWLTLLDMNVVIVLILMVIVAGFNMISTLLIILFEKISTIGLLKALGMDNKGVGDIFKYVSLNIVGKGLIIGNVFALALCLIQKYFKVITLNPDNYFVKYVPIDINFVYILLADILSLFVIMTILRVTSVFIAKVSPDKTMRAA
ncbi:MAG: ABC transporter permease [Bacteroidales bacterium]|nr:ABC transporter permease [Bacteroidales bacterium]